MKVKAANVELGRDLVIRVKHGKTTYRLPGHAKDLDAGTRLVAKIREAGSIDKSRWVPVVYQATPVRKDCTCGKCNGTGQTEWGLCFRCQGKGYQNDADQRRNWGYVQWTERVEKETGVA